GEVLGRGVGEVMAELGLVLLDELGPELRDARMVDARLQLGVRVDPGRGARALGSALCIPVLGDAVVKTHLGASLAPRQREALALFRLRRRARHAALGGDLLGELADRPREVPGRRGESGGVARVDRPRTVSVWGP